MTERQEQLLLLAVDRYIQTAEPVSSQTLSNLANVAVSSATVRNELAVLEELGYLTAPHTSAGRVPTEAGYRFYITSIQEGQARARAPHQALRQRAAIKNTEQRLQAIAAELSALTGEAVVITRGRQPHYTTGLSRLFAQPEFNNVELMREFAHLMDTLETVFAPYARRAGPDVQVLMGRESPLGTHLSSTVIRVCVDGEHGVMGILGPTRMDYAYHIALLTEVQQLLLESYDG